MNRYQRVAWTFGKMLGTLDSMAMGVITEERAMDRLMELRRDFMTGGPRLEEQGTVIWPEFDRRMN